MVGAHFVGSFGVVFEIGSVNSDGTAILEHEMADSNELSRDGLPIDKMSRNSKIELIKEGERKKDVLIRRHVNRELLHKEHFSK